MTIDELNALTTLTATDEVPVWDSEESGEPTKKITASNLAASVKSLAGLPNTTEMNAAIAQSTASDWSGVHSWMSDTERGSCSMAYFGEVLEVSFMTNSRVHAENDVIMTLPEPWHPKFAVDVPSFYRNGCCVLRINTSGVMSIWLLNDTTNAGRIYGHFTLVVP